jgi:hypothetical protein
MEEKEEGKGCVPTKSQPNEVVVIWKGGAAE